MDNDTNGGEQEEEVERSQAEMGGRSGTVSHLGPMLHLKPRPIISP